MTRTLSLTCTLALALATAAACGKDDDKDKARPAGDPAPAAAVREGGGPGASAGRPTAPAEPVARPAPPADPTASWKETRGQGFVVRGPNAPQTQQQTLPSAAGPLPATFYTDFASAGAPGALQVLVTEIPAAIARKTDPATLMAGMRQGAANAVPGGKVVQDRKVTVGGTEGTEVIIAGHHPQAGGFKARMRFFLKDNKIYQVQAIYAEGAADFGVLADKFVDSFGFSG